MIFPWVQWDKEYLNLDHDFTPVPSPHVLHLGKRKIIAFSKGQGSLLSRRYTSLPLCCYVYCYDTEILVNLRYQLCYTVRGSRMHESQLLHQATLMLKFETAEPFQMFKLWIWIIFVRSNQSFCYAHSTHIWTCFRLAKTNLPTAK